MPRRPGSLIGYWHDERGSLRGYPEPPRADATRPVALAQGNETEAEAATPRLRDIQQDHPRRAVFERADPRFSRLEVKDLIGWRARLRPERAEWATLVFRDRHGFRWERFVGLHDDVSQDEAATLLGVPLMRVNRWVRSKRLRSHLTKKGYSVIRVRDIYQLAEELGLEVPRGRALVVAHAADDDDQSTTAEGDITHEPPNKSGTRKRGRVPKKLVGRSSGRSERRAGVRGRRK